MNLIRFRWSVDCSAINEDGALLIFGWVVHDTRAVVALRAALRFNDGSQQAFELVYGIERPDVERAIRDNPRAASCGYYYFGQAQRTDVVALSLEAQLDDGECAVLPTNSTIVPSRYDAAEEGGPKRAAVYGYLAARAWRFILSGRFVDLISTARRYLRGKPKQVTDSIGHVRRLAAAAKSVQLFIDHDLGGGANHVRHTLVKEQLAARGVVFVLTFHVPTLQYVLECRRRDASERLVVDIDALLRALPTLGLERVHWNNAVSFTRPLVLLDAITLLARHQAVPVTYYLHDYHCICPSHFLLGCDGRYCGLGDIGQCAACLPNIHDGLTSLFSERDIHLWRRRWDAFLSATDEIIYFSQASLALVIRTYPQLARHAGLKLRPHSIADFPARSIGVDLQAPLNIGIVGRINGHKGAHVVRQMAQAIEARGADAHITVLGAIDGLNRSRLVTITGSYQRDELPELIARHRINVIAFTSIWPETFSYVVAEVMSLNLPIVCFDLGAPAERLKQYAFGRVVPLGDGAALLDAAEALRKALSSTAGGGQVPPAGCPAVSL